jgi:hypothetical protein
MRIAAMIVALATGVLGATAGPAHAQPQGPFCFTILPFDDVFAFFFVPNGGNQFLGSGRDLLTNSGVTATLFITGNTGVLSFAVPASPASHSALGTADIDLSTGSGPGLCEAVNTTSGCGLGGTNVTMSLVTCPPGALSDARDAKPVTGRSIGGSR